MPSVAKDGNHAAEERVNLVYKTDTGDETPEKELPLKLMVLGDFTGKDSDEALEDRRVLEIKQPNDFENVLKASNVGLDVMVPDLRESESGVAEMRVALKFESLKDFDPDQVVKNVPELKQLLELRDALMELKGPLANEDKFRRRIQEILSGDKQSILDELGIGPTKEPG